MDKIEVVNCFGIPFQGMGFMVTLFGNGKQETSEMSLNVTAPDMWKRHVNRQREDKMFQDKVSFIVSILSWNSVDILYWINMDCCF